MAVYRRWPHKPGSGIENRRENFVALRFSSFVTIRDNLKFVLFRGLLRHYSRLFNAPGYTVTTVTGALHSLPSPLLLLWSLLLALRDRLRLRRRRRLVADLLFAFLRLQRDTRKDKTRLDSTGYSALSSPPRLMRRAVGGHRHTHTRDSVTRATQYLLRSANIDTTDIRSLTNDRRRIRQNLDLVTAKRTVNFLRYMRTSCGRL